MRVLNRDDSGIAMITAVMVSFVVLVLAGTAVQISTHTLSGAQQDRKRVFTFHAAEAGIDRGLLTLQTTGYAALPCASPLTGTLQTQPGSATYSVAFTYYASYPPTGSALACPLTSAPAAVVMSSTGNTSGQVGDTRRVQLAAKLTPAAAGGYNKTIFSDQTMEFDNALVVTGNVGNDAVLYTNGDFNCDNANLLYGSVMAQGSVVLSNSCNVKVDLWANEAVTLGNAIDVGRDLTSSTSSVTMGNANRIGRNVVAGTTATLDNSSTVGGQVIQGNVQPAPPYESLPALSYVQSAWVSAGYTIRSQGSNCAAAVSELMSQTWTTPTVMKVGGCKLSFPNNALVNMRNSIAIITDEAIEFANGATFRKHATATVDPKLYMIAPVESSCAASPIGPADISMGNGTVFESPVRTFLYTPCKVLFANSGQMLGQVYAGQVHIDNTASIAYRPMGSIPGVGNAPTVVTDVAIAYKREVVG